MLPRNFDAVDGLTPVDQCERLARLAAKVPADRAIVEIGVYKGRTAIALAAGAQAGHGAHVWGVDPWELGDPDAFPSSSRHPHRDLFRRKATRQEARRNIRRAGLATAVTLRRGFSVDVAAGWTGPPVGLLYIDGDHRYRSVVSDVEAWAPHLATGAVVAFDDHDRDGVAQAVEALATSEAIVNVDVTARRLALATVP